jgi:hypothetical protein
MFQLSFPGRSISDIPYHFQVKISTAVFRSSLRPRLHHDAAANLAYSIDLHPECQALWSIYLVRYGKRIRYSVYTILRNV